MSLRFKAGYRYLTTEETPRSVHVLGPSAVDPDVFVCRPEGMNVGILMNCGSKYDGHLIGTDIYLDEATAAIVDTRRMAETGTGSGRSPSGDGARSAIAQPSSESQS